MATFVEQNYLEALASYLNELEDYEYEGITAGNWNTTNAKWAIEDQGETVQSHLVIYGRRPEITEKLFAQEGFEDGYLEGLAAYFNGLGDYVYTFTDGTVLVPGEWTATNTKDAIEDSGETVESHFLKYARRPDILDSVDEENETATSQTLTLTTGVDDVVGDSGNDKINGFLDGTDDTFTAGDEINGADGNDTLRIVNSTAGIDLGIATISNVENVNVVNTGALTTLALNSLSLETVSLDEAGAGLTVSEILTSTKFSVETLGGNTLAVQYDDAATTTDDEVTLSVGGAAGGAALDVSDIETVNLTITDDSVLNGANDAAEATALNITASANLDISGGTLALADDAVVTITGSGDVNLATLDDNGAGKGVTLDAAAATGDITATLGPNTVSVTTGAGDDVITDSALADIIVATGAGDDVLDLSGLALTGTDDIDGTDISYDLGTGDEDAVKSDITDYTADADIVTNIESVSGVEVLYSTGVVTALDADDFSAINSFAFSGNLTGGTFNIENEDKLTLLATTTDMDIRPVLDSGTDVVNLTLDAEAASSTHGDIDATQSETINIESVADEDLANTNTITALDVQNNTKINITGDADLTATTATGTELTIDASAATGDVSITVVGGNDAITLGSGDDTAVGGAGADTIDGGAGDDSITGGAGDDVLTGGAGEDTFVYATGVDDSDTFKDFTVADDVYDTDFATTAGTLGAGTTVVETVETSSNAVTLDTANSDVFEVSGAFRSAINDYTDGSEVIDAISDSGLSVDTEGDLALVALYDAGNAYLYEVEDNSGADGGGTGVLAADITLVGVFEGVAADGFTAENFV